MSPGIAVILSLDGVANGAIYLLIGIGLVLIFLVTRVVFVPFGDIAAFAALTLSSLEGKRLPGTAAVVALLAVIATLMEAIHLLRIGKARRLLRAFLGYLVLPLLPVAAVILLAGTGLPAWLRIPLALVLVLPIAPLLDRIFFRPIADASVLLLLTVAVALHFALSGLGLLFFGPEGVRTEPIFDQVFRLGSVSIGAQTLLVVSTAALFSLLLYLFFERTTYGKALRATSSNRTGARLVGIRPTTTSTVAYLLASVLAATSGILISPVTTIYYDSGFLLGLKAFIGSIVGGMVSYPVTAIGAVLVGFLESFAAFFSSSFKEVIVFGFLVPILLWRSLSFAHSDEQVEEID